MTAFPGRAAQACLLVPMKGCHVYITAQNAHGHEDSGTVCSRHISIAIPSLHMTSIIPICLTALSTNTTASVCLNYTTSCLNAGAGWQPYDNLQHLDYKKNLFNSAVRKLSC